MKRLKIVAAVLATLVGTAVLSFAQDSRPHIAVLPFDPVGLSNADAQIITGLFETSLVKTRKYNVIERTQMDAILTEQEFSLSDCTDEECAIEVGRLLSAEQIVLGSLSLLDDTYILNVKIIDVTTGQNLNADSTQAAALVELSNGVEELAFTLAGILSESDKDAVRQARLLEVRAKKEELQNDLTRLNRKDKVRTTGKWATLGAGGLFSTVSGVTFFLGRSAYQNYLDATTEDDVDRYKRSFRTWDIVMVSSAGIGITGVGAFLYLWLSPYDRETAQQRKEEISEELINLDLEILKLEEAVQ